MSIYKLHIKRTVIFAILGVIVAMIVGALSPKVYEGRMQILVGANQMNRPLPVIYPDVQDIIDAGTTKDTPSELDVLRGEGVFYEALQRVGDRHVPRITFSQDELERLYLMYDVVSAKDTSVGLVKVRYYDPQVAADVANEIGNVYNDLRKRSAEQAVADAQVYLDQQVKDSKSGLDIATAKLAAYKTAHHTVDPQIQQARNADEMMAMNNAVAGARADLEAAKAEVLADTHLLAITPRWQKGSVNDIKNPVIQQLENQLADLVGKRDQLRVQYLEDSEQVKEINGTIHGIETRLATEKQKTIENSSFQGESPVWQNLKQSYNAAVARMNSAQQRLDSFTVSHKDSEARYDKLPDYEAEINKLETDRQIQDTKYRRLKDQADGLKFKTNAAARAAQILYSATPDDVPVSPIWSKLALIGTFAGICVGLMYSYSLEALKLRVYTSTQLTELTGLPVLASVPTLPKPQARKLQRSLASANPALLESFRFMAFSMSTEGGPKTVLFSGVGGSVGCSTAAAQYAIAAARTGVKVALVDYDFQDSTITHLFGLDSKTGVRDVLSKTLLPTEGGLAQDTNQENLKVVPIGTQTGIRVSEVPFQHLGALVTVLAKEADLIVIDSPPVDKLADASRLVPFVDEVCLVVSAASTSYRHVPIAQEILRRAGAKKVGIVLTNANQQEEPFSSDNPFLAERGVS